MCGLGSAADPAFLDEILHPPVPALHLRLNAHTRIILTPLVDATLAPALGMTG